MTDRGGRKIEIIVVEYLNPDVNEAKVELFRSGCHRPRQAIKLMMLALDKKKLMGLPLEYSLEKEVPKGTLFAWLVGVEND